MERLRSAQARWASVPVTTRARVIKGAREGLGPEALAEATGKDPFEALAMEVATLLELMRWLEVRAPDILAPRAINSRMTLAKRARIEQRPRGVTLVLAPGNFPLAIAGGDALFALAAGNAVHVKAPLGKSRGLHKLRGALIDAGLDEDLFVLEEGDAERGRALIDKKPDLVVFTGSEANGRAVATACAAHLIPSVLELGGNAPAIVLEDADLKRTARALVWGAFVNNGEVCAAVERAYVVREVFTPLRAAIDDALKDAKAPHSGVGPRRAPGPVFIATYDDERVIEERFLPELALVEVDDEEEALMHANATDHGLIAYVFTKDKGRFRRAAARLHFGTVMQDDLVFAYGVPDGPWAARGRSGWGASRGKEGLCAHAIPRLVLEARGPRASREPWWYPYTARRRRWIARGLRALYGGKKWF